MSFDRITLPPRTRSSRNPTVAIVRPPSSPSLRTNKWPTLAPPLPAFPRTRDLRERNRSGRNSCRAFEDPLPSLGPDDDPLGIRPVDNRPRICNRRSLLARCPPDTRPPVRLRWRNRGSTAQLLQTLSWWNSFLEYSRRKYASVSLSSRHNRPSRLANERRDRPSRVFQRTASAIISV